MDYQGLIFGDGDANDKNNWFFQKYNKGSSRFWTFQVALNILNQRHDAPVIIETGCQRQADDLGAGMSTSIFAEYIDRYDGTLHVVDNSRRHLQIAGECIQQWDVDVYWHHSDSVAWLKGYEGKIDLLYLDSYDYPIFQMSKKYHPKFEKALKMMQPKTHAEIFMEFEDLARPCQEHCVNEFKAVEDQLDADSIVLIDDNRLPGGGKPGLVKEYLIEQGWICLLDFQQTLWVRRV